MKMELLNPRKKVICKDCRFCEIELKAENLGNQSGICRFNPPQCSIVPTAQGAVTAVSWPPVSPIDWCGRGRKRLEEDTKQ